MTREEELPLVIAAKDGNVVAAEKLINQYMNMIKHYCRRYKNLEFLEPEDLHQECILIFYTALQKYDINSGVKFGTHLYSQLPQLYRIVVYTDFVIKRPANYVAEIKKDETIKMYAFSIDEEIGGFDDSRTFKDTYADSSDTPDLDLLKKQRSRWLAQVIWEVLGYYTEDEILHLLAYYDLYEIMDYPVLDDPTNFKSYHRHRLYKSFMKRLRILALDTSK